MSKHLMCLALVCLCSTFGRSQNCAERLTGVTYTCVYGTTCSGRITVYQPVFGVDRIAYSCTSEECCKQLFTTCTNDSACPFSPLNPQVRARIDEVATTSEVLVADCKGRYSLYARRRSETTIDLDRVLAADSISMR